MALGNLPVKNDPFSYEGLIEGIEEEEGDSDDRFEDNDEGDDWESEDDSFEDLDDHEEYH